MLIKKGGGILNKRQLVQRMYNMTNQFNRITVKRSQSLIPKSEYIVIYLLLNHYKEKQIMLTSRDVADLMHVSSPAISRTVKSLVQKDWVNQIDNPDDRRNIFLEVTDKGKDIFDQTFQQMESTLEVIFDEFTEGDILTFVETGERLTQIMEKIYIESEE